MIKLNVIFGLLIAFSVSAFSAEPQCFKYNNDGVVLTGKVVLKTFFGPPNYGEDPANDAKEKQAILILDSPICVDADPQGDEEAEVDQSEVTLVPMQNLNLEQYVGKRVQVIGSLFHAISAHHHTPVLISVTEQPKLVQ